MYNLGAPQDCYMDEFDALASSKSPANRRALERLRPQVKRAYGDYIRAGRSIHSLTPQALARPDSALLYKTFDGLHKGRPLAYVRDELMASAQNGHCPYCRVGEVFVLDHILERKIFPEFATLRLNLAPVCASCNSKKQTNASSFPGPPLHVYSSPFPSEDFLLARLVRGSLRGWLFKFSVNCPAKVPSVNFEAVSRHFELLELPSRYARAAISALGDRRLEILEQHALGGSRQVSTYLERAARSQAANWSRNDWLAAALRSAAENEEFCAEGIFEF